MATVTSPSSLAESTKTRAYVVNPRIEIPQHPPKLMVPPGGSNVGGSPTVGQLFPIGTR